MVVATGSFAASGAVPSVAGTVVVSVRSSAARNWTTSNRSSAPLSRDPIRS
ncbi:hypothetical protein ACFFQW_11320 [Umezawaea endophytica]|uniref:Uncharacterized protein n=1 Tax=Umezawaea endophytica TaxID=1654476 RepID=A0A9X2VMN4_9PSEU|nr:hypothetical protein [Umezawaea endophytica]MCS7478013.1 hypothetical protein [Umezawaea endophytica]